MKPRRSWWLIFAAGAAVVIAALAWVTVVLLRLEAERLQAHAETRHQEAIRLALWRLDFWLGPQVAREATRPYFEYLAYYPQERAYTRFLNAIDPADVLTASPLLTFRSEFFPLHFQVGADGQVTSPQVPVGNQRDLAEATACTTGEIDAQHVLLAEVRGLVEPSELFARVAEAERRLELANPATPPASPPDGRQEERDQQLAGPWRPTAPPGYEPKQTLSPPAQTGSFQGQQAEVAQTLNEYNRRQESSKMGQQSVMAPPQTFAAAADFARMKDARPQQVAVGPLVPIWISRQVVSDPAQLVFLRSVRASGQECVQGFMVNWPRLRVALLKQVNDLFTQPDLEPIMNASGNAYGEGTALATIPALLRPGNGVKVWCPLLTPARMTLGVAWLAVCAAIPAAGMALRFSIIYGQKRSRFASAVTHELRTPLTTFRMYSEMLADGMVTSQSQRQEYLDTLKRSSLRLATLVENVLAYARIEDGRSTCRAQATTLGEMLDRLAPPLARRAADADMKLEIDPAGPSDARLVVDVDAVGQILFNLVDNACKYAAVAGDRRLHLEAALSGPMLTLIVRDHGPGIAPEHARAVFLPFERGAHQPGDTIPGVGLGLALARELARDLGGDLVLDHAATGGACFRLTVPIQARSHSVR